MQYESIILELMTRIKTLEEEVLRIKEEQKNFSKLLMQTENENQEEEIVDTEDDLAVPYRKMTDEMIDICYQYGKKAYDGKSISDLADEINRKTGMNKNSAVMYLYAVSGMLNGTIYKRAINTRATQRYLDKILSDYGKEGLQKALRSLKLHIDYRRACGHTVDSIEEAYQEYMSKV